MTKLHTLKSSPHKKTGGTANKFSGLPFLLMVAFLLLTSVGWTQVSGDYRSKNTGLWDVATNWESYNGSTWAVASVKPGATNSVYIQSGHIMSLGMNEACNDLNLCNNTTSATSGTVRGKVDVVTNTLEVNGKLRSYWGAVGVVPGTTMSGVTNQPYNGTGVGRIKFVGNSRNITNTGEWGATTNSPASSNCDIEVALNAGQVGTFQTNIKAGNWFFTSGTMNILTVAPDKAATLANVTIGPNATVISGTSSNTFHKSSNTVAGTLTVDGKLVFTGTAPKVQMTSVVFNGTVMFDAAGPQNLVTKGSGTTPGVDPNTYNNLYLSNDGVKTLGLNITVNGTLALTGTASLGLGTYALTYGPASTLKYNGSSVQNTAVAELPATGGPNTLVIDNISGVSHAGAATINNLTVSAGTFTIESGASLITNGAVTGLASVKRDIGGTGFHLVSSPISSVTAGDVFPLTSFVRKFDEPSLTWKNLVASDPLLVGKGYSLQMPDGPNTSVFTGTLNNSDVVLSGLSITGATANYSGFHLLGNPFTSALQWDGTWATTNIDASVYVWDNGNYKAGNGLGTGTLPGDIIPAQQGFFVKVTSGTGAITIPSAKRVHSLQAFYKESTPELLKLTASGNGYEDAMTVHFNAAASAGFDSQYDAYKLWGNDDAPQLFSIIQDNILTINELPAEGNETVNLGFKCAQTGAYSITASGIESFNSSMPVSIEDTKTNTIHDLRVNPQYTFSYSAGEPENRFKLHFKNTDAISEVSSCPIHMYSAQGIVYLSNPNNLKGTVEVMDLTGRILISTHLTGNLTDKIETGTHGCLLVKVTTNRGEVTKKIIVN
jgi:hypothetical protein